MAYVEEKIKIENKLRAVEKLIDRGDYFLINRPRQYGKTTLISQITKSFKDKYLIIRTSFEGIGDAIFKSEDIFSNQILDVLAESLDYVDNEKAEELRKLGEGLITLKDVSKALGKFVRESKLPVVLIIDEVDKASNNQLFLSFLGMLRNRDYA